MSAFESHAMTMPVRSLIALTALVLAHTSSLHAQAPNMGLAQLRQQDGGTTTVFYPTEAPEAPARRGPFDLRWASDAQAAKGNGRLIVISHGSGGSPWVHTDLARVLVQRGYVVAMPEHHGDNYLDTSDPGPVSWLKRPAEVSGAIDAVAGNAALASLLSLDSVGVLGGSAGGHTALTLAGGQWSFARFRDHCERNIERDFSSCVGFTTLLKGDWLDGPKLWLAKGVIASRFRDEKVQQYTDPRIKSAVAMVPFAADFVPQSLANPRIPLGLVVAAKDVNQIPEFHVQAIRAACEPRCEVIMSLAEGSHGAMLSPMPPLKPGSVAAHLLSDPAAFDRSASLAALHGRVADFFFRTLGVGR